MADGFPTQDVVVVVAMAAAASATAVTYLLEFITLVNSTRWQLRTHFTA